jgi:hypothetical protein
MATLILEAFVRKDSKLAGFHHTVHPEIAGIGFEIAKASAAATTIEE